MIPLIGRSWNPYRGNAKHPIRSAIKNEHKTAKARRQREKMKRHHKRNHQCKYRRH